jgi:hypothetical protein
MHVTFPRIQSISHFGRQYHMAKKATINLSETIREFQKSHRGVSAKDAFEAIKRAHPGQKIKEGTFKAVFYKFAGGGKRKVVKRRKSVRIGHDMVVIENRVLAIVRAAQELIALTGDSKAAKAVIDHM